MPSYFSSTVGEFVELTGDQTVGGTKTFSSPVLLPDGTVGAPALTFSSDPDTGLFRVDNNKIRIAAGGIEQVIFSSVDTRFRTPVYVPDGTAAAPSLAFENNTNTGIRMPAVGDLRIVSGGTDYFSVSANRVLVVGASTQLQLPAGSAAAPALTFSNDTDTGIFRTAADTLDITTNGTRRLRVGTSGLVFEDGFNIFFDTTTGTKIGTATNQKLGFFDATPVTQRQGVAVSAAGIHAALVELGLITA